MYMYTCIESILNMQITYTHVHVHLICLLYFIWKITIILVIKYTHCDKYTNQGAFKGGGMGAFALGSKFNFFNNLIMK